MFSRPFLAGLAAAAVLLGGFPASSETFTPLPDQTYDVDQPGPRGEAGLGGVGAGRPGGNGGGEGEREQEAGEGTHPRRLAR